MAPSSELSHLADRGVAQMESGRGISDLGSAYLVKALGYLNKVHPPSLNQYHRRGGASCKAPLYRAPSGGIFG